VHSARYSRRDVNIWPGFVDALAALLMVIIFLLLIFTIGQFYLSHTLSGKEETLVQLNKQVSQLADLLALEKTTSTTLQQEVSGLTAQLAEKNENLSSLQQQVSGLTTQLAEKNENLNSLQADITLLTELRSNLEKDIAKLATELRTSKKELRLSSSQLQKSTADAKSKAHELEKSDEALRAEQEISARSLAQIELLNYQVKALRNQLGAVSAALGLEIDVENESVEKIAERLNIALAEKAQELARYRSDFFGRLRDVLGNNPDIRVVGDRFVLQSGLLFASGSAELGQQGKQQVRKLSDTLNSVAANIPGDIDWIVRIDGHTDRQPINTAEYPSNWELSTARALAIVRFMISQGVPARRLAATGFGEFHPLDSEKTAEAYAINRRIEIKLTSK